jgi:uncharacterized membrane protein
VLVDWVDMRVRVPLAILALGLTLAPLAAPLLAASNPLAALLIRNFFSQLCHQDRNRSFLLDGAPVAVCVRCLGIYCGVAVGALVRLRLGRRLLGLALALNLVDVATGALHWHGNLPVFRFFLGLMIGAGVAAVLLLPEGFWPLRSSPLKDVSASRGPV